MRLALQYLCEAISGKPRLNREMLAQQLHADNTRQVVIRPGHRNCGKQR